MESKVRVRIAPAPTGKLHVGTAHTALFNYFFAKHHQGIFILRIDDSDPDRSKREHEQDILQSLKWLGINWDEGADIGGPFGPYRQSERKKNYQKYIQLLLKANKAYYCYCTTKELVQERKKQQRQGLPTKYSGKCSQLGKSQEQKLIQEGKRAAVRFRTPDKKVFFTDLIRGKIEVDANTFGDFVIARQDGSALLNLAATVDDIEMKITHAIRGEDFINLVPRQVLIFEALDHLPPKFAHLSFLYAPDRTKLSKRHGATSVTEYKRMGVLPEAMVNYLATLGWAIPDQVLVNNRRRGIAEEVLTVADIIKHFRLQDVKSSAPIFNIKKLMWINGEYIRQLPVSSLQQRLQPFIADSVDKQLILRLIPLAKERMRLLTEFQHYLKPFINFKSIELDPEQQTIVRLFVDKYQSMKPWSAKELKAVSKQVIDEHKLSMSKALMAVRLAATGEKIGLPLFESMEILGQKESLQRLRAK